MADRQTKVTLSVQMQQYIDGMQKAAKATRETGTEAAKLTQQKQSFDLLGRASLAAGVAIGAGLTVAVAKAADFNQAMSSVQAATHESAESMASLREAALEAGATTVFTATESANAIEELAKAGLSTSDILGGALAGSLDLASAGGLGVARAAEIASITLQQFKLTGEDASHVADLLAAGAGKAMGDVEDLAQALNQSGLVASQFGISVEETTGTLAAFASAGLLGSDAGTSFRTMLLRLAKPTEEVKGLMKEIGFEAYNAQGQFIGLSGLAGELETSLAGMTDEQKQTTLAMIFGQDAIRAATVLYEEGADGISEWTSKVDDAGYASETAAIKLDNLKGDWEAFTGALDTALITMGDAADGPLRELVQGLTGLIDKFNEMPAGAQQAVFWVGAVASAGATALGSYLLLVPKMAELKSALDVLGPSAQRAGRAVSSIAKGAGVTAALAVAVTAASNALVDYARAVRGTDDAVSEALTTNQSFTDALDGLKVTTDATADGVVRALDAISSGNTLGTVGLDVLTLRDALAELGPELADLPVDAAIEKFQAWGDELGLSKTQMSTLLNEMPELRDAIRKYLTDNGDAADAQSILNFALKEGAGVAEKQAAQLEVLQGVAVDTTEDVNELAEAIRNFGTAQFDTDRAQIKFAESLLDVNELLADGAASLDVNTEAGQRTLSTFLDSAQATNDYAGAVAAMGGSTEQVQGILEAGRQKIIDTRIALGDSEEAAKLYADQLIATPETVATQVELNGLEAAQASLQRFKDTLNSIPNYKGISVDTITGNPSLGYVPGNADGGAVVGAGGPRSDSILRRLSNGEHVLDAGDVNEMGGQHGVYAFRHSLHSGGGGTGLGKPGPSVHIGSIHAHDDQAVAAAINTELSRAMAVMGV